MFDILVYVFENYLPGACPEPEALARKLSSVGFADEAISEAIQWLAGLEQAQAAGGFDRQPTVVSSRVYSDRELLVLPVDCRGFLTAMESVGAIDAVAREMIIDRAMAANATDMATLTLGKFKVIVLMVMWQCELSLDNLIFEDLLEEDDEDWVPLLH